MTAERDALVKRLRDEQERCRKGLKHADQGEHGGWFHAHKLAKDAADTIAALTAQPSAGEPVSADHVICPACCNQFRAIPVNVQKLMLAAGFKPPFTAAPTESSPETVVVPRSEIEHWLEYWNGSHNERAM